MDETNRFTIGIIMADGSHCNIDVEPVGFLDYDDNIISPGFTSSIKAISAAVVVNAKLLNPA